MSALRLPEDKGWMGDRARGASMGRPDRGLPCACAVAGSHKFHLRKINLDSGGYDSGGAYWGHGQQLWWATSIDGTAESFFRAADRTAARAEVLSDHPGARFFR